MSIAFARWAALCGAVSTINVVKGWVSELRDFVRDVQEVNQIMRRMENEYTTVQAEFKLWLKMWDVDQNVSRSWLFALWGKTSGTITQQMELIKILLQEIEQTLGEFRETPALTSASQPKRLQRSVIFVISERPKIIRKLENTRTTMAAVKRLSKDAFQIHNGEQVQGDVILRSEVESKKWNHLFQEIYESRLASKRLYEICYTARGKFFPDDLDPNIDIFRQRVEPLIDQDRLPLSLHYHFFLAWESKISELLVEGPCHPKGGPYPGNFTNVASDFYGACRGNCLLPVYGFADESWFRAYVPQQSRRISVPQEEEQFKSLPSLLYDLRVAIDHEPLDRFSRSERLRVAFKLAECGLFLSGTTWLTHLQSSRIRCARDDRHDRQFLLGTEAFRQSYNDSHYKEFATHVYAIGLLFAEIGIGRCIGVVRRSRTTGYAFHVYSAGDSPPSNPQEVPESRVLEILRINMGCKYADVVKNCLESRESWREAKQLTPEGRSEGYTRLLREYYDAVYSP